MVSALIFFFPSFFRSLLFAARVSIAAAAVYLKSVVVDAIRRRLDGVCKLAILLFLFLVLKANAIHT